MRYGLDTDPITFRDLRDALVEAVESSGETDAADRLNKLEHAVYAMEDEMEELREALAPLIHLAGKLNA